MKKFIALLVAAVLIVSMVGVLTAFAGCGISGNSEVYAGSTYKYTGNASYTGADLVARLSGLGKDASFNKDSGGSGNGSLSGSCSISVTIPSDAAVGTKYTISLSGQYSTVDEAGNPSDHSFSDSKTITVIAKPVSTPKPSTSKPASTPKPSTSAPEGPTVTPTATPAPTGWALAATEVPAMAQGGEYDMQITDDSVVPAAVLAAVKDKQGVLNVDFGTYSCTVNGAALSALPEGVAGIDLGMTMEKDAALSTAAGGTDVYQLHFKHSGALPGRFTYRFKAEQNKPGDVVYLYYYYNESGVTEGKQQCVVDADGYVSVDIYHCSSYFVSGTLIEGAAGIIAQPEPSATAEPTPTPAATPKATDNLSVSALGPVEQWFGIPYAPLIAALVAMALLSMLLTMMITRSGLFKRRTRATASDSLFAPETPGNPIVPDDDKTDDDIE